MATGGSTSSSAAAMAGHRANADQFLLIAEYLSGGRDRVELYVLRPGGTLVVTEAAIQRDDRGRIHSLRAGDSIATFGYGTHDLVDRFDLEPAHPAASASTSERQR